MNDLISSYIDNELNLDEKIDFVDKVHTEEQFYTESVDLLKQEKLLRSDVISFVPQVSFKEKRKIFNIQSLTPFLRVAEFAAVAVLVLFFVFSIHPVNEVPSISKRFVIYEPDAASVQIAGSFTDWKDVPMTMIGPSGYWEINLDVTKGEHKYVFIVGDGRKIADPTILMRERDDFGSENSVLFVEA
jgi:hypothetical protein